MKWWRIESTFRNDIVPVEVIKETPAYVIWIANWFGKPDQRRSQKAGEFFPTWKEAHDFMLEGAQNRVNGLAGQLEAAQKRLRVISDMKSPDQGDQQPVSSSGVE